MAGQYAFAASVGSAGIGWDVRPVSQPACGDAALSVEILLESLQGINVLLPIGIALADGLDTDMGGTQGLPALRIA